VQSGNDAAIVLAEGIAGSEDNFVALMNKRAAELGLTLPQLALAWVLRRPEVTSAIIGASRPEQVVENAAASGVRLDAATVARVEAALG
jgi:aryl-alcohol dehydrogenase-like predicted oxidoreductase